MGQMRGVLHGTKDGLHGTHSYQVCEFSTLAKEDTVPIIIFFKSNKGNYNRINRFFFFPPLPHIRESIIPELWVDAFLLYMEMY